VKQTTELRNKDVVLEAFDTLFGQQEFKALAEKPRGKSLKEER